MAQLENMQFFDCLSSLEPYSCINCNFECYTLLQLKKHNKKQHLGCQNKINCLSDYTLRRYICARCSFETHSTLQWFKHEGCLLSRNEMGLSGKQQDMQESNKPAKIFECIDRGSLFKWKQNLKDHFGVKHTDEMSTEIFKCQDNDSMYRSKDVLVGRDIKIKHGANKDQKLLECGQNKVNCSSDYTLQSYICAKCSFETHSVLQWLKHGGCLLSKGDMDPGGKPQDIPEFIKPTKILECIDRGTLFKWKQNLKDHIGVKHTDEKDNDSTYRSKDVLVRHSEIKHGANKDEKHLECDYCEYKTPWKSYLKKHIAKHVYKVKKWFQCDRCTFKTTNMLNIKKHHHAKPTDITWLNCDQCAFKTKSKHYLEIHIFRKHAPHDDKKWLQCEHCHFRTKHKSILNTHCTENPCDESKQWRNNCDKCTFKTQSKYCLAIHILTKHVPHEDKKWFNCDNCNFKTKYTSILNTHYAENFCDESEKWLNCDKCTFQTLWKCNLNKHYEENHIDYTLPSYNCVTSSVETHSILQGTKSDGCLLSKDEIDLNRKEQDSQESNKSAKILECIDRGSLFKWKQNLKDRINVSVKHTDRKST